LHLAMSAKKEYCLAQKKPETTFQVNERL